MAIVVKEKLQFPSGSATATLIAVLNNTKIHHEADESKSRSCSLPHEYNEVLISGDNDSTSSNERTTLLEDNISVVESRQQAYQRLYYENVRSLIITFSISSFYTLCSYFLPVLRNIPIFGKYIAKNYLWTLQPSPSYIGQGIIMGLLTVSYMLFGAILG